MARSRYCLVPAGDTPSSRRLYDALAAGCVPVYLGDEAALRPSLPFHASTGVTTGMTTGVTTRVTTGIEWGELLFYGGGMQQLADDAQLRARLGEASVDLRVEVWRTSRALS